MKVIRDIILAGVAFLSLGIVGFAVAAGSAAIEILQERKQDEEKAD